MNIYTSTKQKKYIHTSNQFKTKNRQNILLCRHVYIYIPFRFQWLPLLITFLSMFVIVFSHMCFARWLNIKFFDTFLFSSVSFTQILFPLKIHLHCETISKWAKLFKQEVQHKTKWDNHKMPRVSCLIQEKKHQSKFFRFETNKINCFGYAR